MTEWQRVWLQRNKDKKIREVFVVTWFDEQWIRTGKVEENPEEEGRPVDPFEPEGTGIPIDQTRTKFHGKEEKDYQGRSWIVAPSDVKPVDNPHSYLPKKTIHKWYSRISSVISRTGHTGPVQCIEFFPVTGHLLISGGNDTKVKIWDVFNKRNVKRT